MDGPQMVAANTAADEHGHVLGTTARLSVLGHPGLSGNEYQPIAEARKDSPSDEVEIPLGEKGAEITDDGGHDPRKEHCPGPEPIRESTAERNRDRTREHEQCNRESEQKLIRYDGIDWTEPCDEQRKERARQFFREHEQKQRHPHLHGVSGPQRLAAGEAVTVLDLLTRRPDSLCDALVNLSIPDLACVELEVFVALPQTAQCAIQGGYELSYLVARTNQELVAEDSPCTVRQYRLDAFHRSEDPHAHQEHQDFQRHEQGHHDDGHGFVQEIGQPVANVLPAHPDMQHGADRAVDDDRKCAVDEPGDFGLGGRCVAGVGQAGQDAFQNSGSDTAHEQHLGRGIEDEQVLDVRVR